MRSIQSDLFAPPPAWLRTVLRRLPAQDFLSVADVALAFGVSSTTATEWIEEGRLEAVNLNAGTGKKTYWRIPRESAVALAKHIAEGVCRPDLGNHKGHKGHKDGQHPCNDPATPIPRALRRGRGDADQTVPKGPRRTL